MMTPEKIAALKRGDHVNVRFGANGMQEALVLQTMGGDRPVQVTKFRANSGRWTRPMWIPASDILGCARTPVDAATVQHIEALAKAPGRRVN